MLNQQNPQIFTLILFDLDEVLDLKGEIKKGL